MVVTPKQDIEMDMGLSRSSSGEEEGDEIMGYNPNGSFIDRMSVYFQDSKKSKFSRNDAVELNGFGKDGEESQQPKKRATKWSEDEGDPDTFSSAVEKTRSKSAPKK